MLDLSRQRYANIRSEISLLTRIQQHEVGIDIFLRNAAHTALMPMTTEVRARLAYDTSLAFKQPHQLWLKPWRRIQYNFKTSCPNHEAFQGITRLGLFQFHQTI